jgi:hypothetical protein
LRTKTRDSVVGNEKEALENASKAILADVIRPGPVAPPHTWSRRIHLQNMGEYRWHNKKDMGGRRRGREGREEEEKGGERGGGEGRGRRRREGRGKDKVQEGHKKVDLLAAAGQNNCW